MPGSSPWRAYESRRRLGRENCDAITHLVTFKFTDRSHEQSER